MCFSYAASAVSIHAPAREATCPRGISGSEVAIVSIHAPAREATRAGYPPGAQGRSFNPRPRAGSDSHASPSASVTSASGFQSTPPRGKRRGSASGGAHHLFQSTPPRGKRPLAALLGHGQEVSIHAPAREATRAAAKKPLTVERSFNPRPRAGSDVHSPAVTPVAERMGFQSTPPRGKRPQRRTRLPWGPSFNPRPRAGSDLAVNGIWSYCTCFNPRPRAGSDWWRPGFDPARFQWFQSTPPRGKRRARVQEIPGVAHSVSIHAPAREATRLLS